MSETLSTLPPFTALHCEVDQVTVAIPSTVLVRIAEYELLPLPCVHSWVEGLAILPEGLLLSIRPSTVQRSGPATGVLVASRPSSVSLALGIDSPLGFVQVRPGRGPARAEAPWLAAGTLLDGRPTLWLDLPALERAVSPAQPEGIA